MSPTAGCQGDGWWSGASKGLETVRGGLRALLRTLRRWWGKDPYRPERSYMRG